MYKVWSKVIIPELYYKQRLKNQATKYDFIHLIDQRSYGIIMKRVIAPFLFFVLGCTQADDSTLYLELSTPIAVNIFCQESADQLKERIEYSYKNGQLAQETRISNGKEISKMSFIYDTDGKLSQRIEEISSRKIKRNYLYDNSGLLINVVQKIIDFDMDGQVVNEVVSEAPLEYENGLLVKEWTTWGGFSIYTYENEKMLTKTDYTKQGTAHHITSYHYSRDLLVEERKTTITGNILYSKTFSYNKQNQLLAITDRGNIVEENRYERNRLTEKKIYYFGIDPGYDVCHGNYIYRYEY